METKELYSENKQEAVRLKILESRKRAKAAAGGGGGGGGGGIEPPEEPRGFFIPGGPKYF